MIGLISAAVGALSALAATAIGGSLGTGLIAIIPILISIDKIVDIIISIAKKMGIIEEDEDIQERGDKVIQAEEKGITSDKYETWSDYEKAIDKFEINPEKSLEIDDKDKRDVGFAYCLKVIENEIDFDISTLLVTLKENPGLLSEEKIELLIKGLKEEGYSAVDMKEYFSGDLSARDSMKIEKIIDDIK